MKRLLFFLTLSCFSGISFSQYVYQIKADSVRIHNDSCKAELILENSTKNINGFLRNRGNGRTEFAYAIDSVWLDNNLLLKFRIGSNILSFDLNAANAGFLDSLKKRIDSAWTANDSLFLRRGDKTIQVPVGKNYTFNPPFVANGKNIGLPGYNNTNWDAAYLWGNHAGLYPLMSNSYVNPSWVSSLAWNKISGIPAEFIPLSNSTYYIQNQNSVVQSARFRVNGESTIENTFTVKSANPTNYTTLITLGSGSYNGIYIAPVYNVGSAGYGVSNQTSTYALYADMRVHPSSSIKTIYGTNINYTNGATGTAYAHYAVDDGMSNGGLQSTKTYAYYTAITNDVVSGGPNTKYGLYVTMNDNNQVYWPHRTEFYGAYVRIPSVVGANTFPTKMGYYASVGAANGGGSYAFYADSGQVFIREKLIVLGAQEVKRTVLTTTTTLDDKHHYLAADATTTGFSISLPAASACTGRVYRFKKIDDSINVVTINPNGSDTIEGAMNYTLSSQWQKVTLIAGSSGWEIF